MISSKKILITGGAGFIGSNLCDYFTSPPALSKGEGARGNYVVCLDNFSTGKKASRHAELVSASQTKNPVSSSRFIAVAIPR